LPHLVAAFSETEQFLVGIVVQRTGLDPATDSYPRLLAAIVMTLLRVTMQRRSDEGHARPLRDLIDESFDQLARDFRSPTLSSGLVGCLTPAFGNRPRSPCRRTVRKACRILHA